MVKISIGNTPKLDKLGRFSGIYSGSIFAVLAAGSYPNPFSLPAAYLAVDFYLSAVKGEAFPILWRTLKYAIEHKNAASTHVQNVFSWLKNKTIHVDKENYTRALGYGI